MKFSQLNFPPQHTAFTMAGLGARDILRNVTALEQLIEEINFQRAKEMRQCLMSKDSGECQMELTTCSVSTVTQHC